MTIDCTKPDCITSYPASSVVSVFGELPQKMNGDPSTTILYLTDEAGVVDTATTGSPPLLSKENRLSFFSSHQSVNARYLKCSRTSLELLTFFSYRKGTLVRPASILVGYFDSASESMSEALAEITKCFTGFYVLTHVAYDKSGAALADSAQQLELGDFGNLSRTVVVKPTIDEANAIKSTDSASNAFKSKTAGHDYSVYMLLNEYCRKKLDASCNKTAVDEALFGSQHLVMAGVIAGISKDSANYQFNVKMKPMSGLNIGVSTASMSLSDSRMVNGVIPEAGGVQKDWAHHINTYVNIAGLRVITEGVGATGEFIDDLIHRRNIGETINMSMLEMLTSNQNVSMSSLSQVRTNLIELINRFVRNGVIADEAGDVTPDDFDNVFASGNSWILIKSPTKQVHQDSRITPTFEFRYKRQGGTNFVSVYLGGIL